MALAGCPCAFGLGCSCPRPLGAPLSREVATFDVDRAPNAYRTYSVDAYGSRGSTAALPVMRFAPSAYRGLGAAAPDSQMPAVVTDTLNSLQAAWAGLTLPAKGVVGALGYLALKGLGR